MSIPESQLKRWTKQGATSTAQATHTSVRTALRAESSPISSMLSSDDAEIYLQGSYKNTTNIYGDSDVDIIVQLNRTWGRDLTALNAEEKQRYEEAYSDATYTWSEFRSDVLEGLVEYYDAGQVDEGSKCLKVADGSGRLAADVVVAIEYRNYRRFRSAYDQEYVEGIRFKELPGGRIIINYPKPHYENGVAKNAVGRTSQNYKPAVRMLKNARSYLVGRGALGENVAPSYFLECMVYNVPDGKFTGTWQDIYAEIVEWLATEASLSQFVCQNEQMALFGETPEQWTTADARSLIDGYVALWNNW